MSDKIPTPIDDSAQGTIAREAWNRSGIMSEFAEPTGRMRVRLLDFGPGPQSNLRVNL